MPELVEGIAHFLTTLWALALYGYGPWPVLALWVDLTKTEAEAARLKTGLVQRLHQKSTMKRGTNKRQTPLLAEELILSPDNPSPIPITALTLRAVHHSVRALIVDLGVLWLRVSNVLHPDALLDSLDILSSPILPTPPSRCTPEHSGRSFFRSPRR